MGTGILSLLAGINRGRRDAEERREQREARRRAEQRAELALIAELSRLPGFSIGGGAPTPPLPPGPSPTAAPAAPNPPGLSTGPGAIVDHVAPPVGLRSPALEAAREALRPTADTPQAPAAPAAPAPPPGSLVDLGTLTLGGAPRTITFDPSQTAGAKKAQRDVLNRRAYQELEAEEPGSQGEYDPDFDYVREARRQREIKRYEEFLVTQLRMSPEDARGLAEFNYDADEKRRENEELRLRRMGATQRAEEFRASQASKRVEDLAEEAAGYLASGMKPELLGETLKVMHPEASVSEITRAVGMARSQAELQAATIAQRTRSGSGSGTFKIGGVELDPSTLGAPESSTAALPPISPEDRAKAASDPEFAAWLRSKGYQF